MSITDQTTRIVNAKEAMRVEINGKKVSVGTGVKLASYPALIRSIPRYSGYWVNTTVTATSTQTTLSVPWSYNSPPDILYVYNDGSADRSSALLWMYARLNNGTYVEYSRYIASMSADGYTSSYNTQKRNYAAGSNIAVNNGTLVVTSNKQFVSGKKYAVKGAYL